MVLQQPTEKLRQDLIKEQINTEKLKQQYIGALCVEKLLELNNKYGIKALDRVENAYLKTMLQNEKEQILGDCSEVMRRNKTSVVDINIIDLKA